jgi:hypothetical protein
MSLAEILPAVRSLPRDEQTQLVHWLVEELARPDEQEINRRAELLAQLVAAAPHQLDRPDFRPGAAAVLEQVLAEHREQAGGRQ